MGSCLAIATLSSSTGRQHHPGSDIPRVRVGIGTAKVRERNTLMTKVVLLFALALPGFAQSVPSDAAKLSIPELAQFVEIVCPSPVKDAQTCNICPPESDFPNDKQGWQVAAITFGHFTTPEGREALMSTTGCASHAAGLGGSFLLRDDGGGYRKVWYRSGYIATDCKKLKASDARDVLVCESSDMHHGVSDEFLYLLDLNWTAPDTPWPSQLFFMVLDSLNSCVALNDGYALISYIENVHFSTRPNSETVDIIVKANAGKAVLSQKVLDNCNLNSKPGDDKYKPVIATKPLTFRFVFDGLKVQSTPGNPSSTGIEPTVPVTSYYVPQPGHPMKLRR